MTHAHILGFPRIGAHRELKFAQEAFWRSEIDEVALKQIARELRQKNWALQRDAGLDFVTVGDFAWYDQVLNTLALLGALPSRFGFDAKNLSLTQYYTAARGDQQQFAMEMTKWFDTNYHYLVPEWNQKTEFKGGVNWLFEEVEQAKALQHKVKVSLLGPLSLLFLGKVKQGLNHPLDLLHKILPAYQHVLKQLKEQGVEWVQIEEPILALDLSPEWLRAFQPSYQVLAQDAPSLLFTTYFGAVDQHVDLIRSLDVAGLHLDLVRAPEQLNAFLKNWPAGRVLSAGIIDGRNIWRADLSLIQEQWTVAQNQLGKQFWISASCSLLHVPVDLENERQLDTELLSWLAFAAQKLIELHALKSAFNAQKELVQHHFDNADLAIQSRAQSKRIHIDSVKKRVANVQAQDAQRQQVFIQRNILQKQRFALPLFPTTTIGSFPQTSQIRQARAAYKRGELKHLEYLEAMRAEIAHVVQEQENIGLDVLVHGEAERNDMVEYFGEQIWGYAFTQLGWVQSYGSRCVKPPIIYGDVFRPEAMTVSWSAYAQSLTEKPMKGMLTGPITMLQWSFVRDDQARSTTALQIALALRDEVNELEQAGIGMIQIDEPAIREGLPLKQKDWQAYLDWAVHAFKICSSGVRDDTQIHTHMCYSEFNDILPWIAAMDADVITIETSRSDMKLLDGFGEFDYPNEIGPGVYDIHSPRIPNISEMQNLLEKARRVIPDEHIWVNPDCGLKTRNWQETKEALKNMVHAARLLRTSVQQEEHSEDCC
jgi:5-methyltetrahydropteroyltriglutamate--homocysteine methyltransferase